jgi:hypothetical protein
MQQSLIWIMAGSFLAYSYCIDCANLLIALSGFGEHFLRNILNFRTECCMSDIVIGFV